VLVKNALCVAGRYAALRKQFGREDNEEYSILNYPTTQMRLIPALAENFAFKFASNDLVQKWIEVEVNILYNNSLLFRIQKMIK